MIRAALIWFGVGLAAAMAEAGLADPLSVAFSPDLSLLAAMAAALALAPAPGLVLVCVLGLCSDLLSGALLGQHALARIIEFAALRAIADKFDLRRPLAKMALAWLMVHADAMLQACISWLFFGDFALAWRSLPGWALRAAITALFAPAAAAMASFLVARLSDGDTVRKMSLDTKRPVI